MENVIVAGLSEECNCRGALLEGRRLICAHRFDSSAHTHFVSTCASSAHTDLTHARTQSIGETQVRTQALSRMFAHLKGSSKWNSSSKFYPSSGSPKGESTWNDHFLL